MRVPSRRWMTGYISSSLMLLHSSFTPPAVRLLNSSSTLRGTKKKCSRTFNITFLFKWEHILLVPWRKECFCMNVFSASIDVLIHVKELIHPFFSGTFMGVKSCVDVVLSVLCQIVWFVVTRIVLIGFDVFPDWDLHPCSQQMMTDRLHFQFIDAAVAAAATITTTLCVILTSSSR